MTREARITGYCTACHHMVRPGEMATTAPGLAKVPGVGWAATYVIVGCVHCPGNIYAAWQPKHDQRRVALAV